MADTEAAAGKQASPIRKALADAVVLGLGLDFRGTAGEFADHVADMQIRELAEAGYRIVPREPTAAMIGAIDDLNIFWTYRSGSTPGIPEDAWRAMWDAAE